MQPTKALPTRRGGSFAGRAPRQSNLAEDAEELQAPYFCALLGVVLATSRSVSYTHLDVYKRQRLSFQPWGTWAAGWDNADAEATWEHISRSPSMSIDKAKRLLGYEPRYTSLEGVFDSLAWLVSNGKIDVGGRQLSP